MKLDDGIHDQKLSLDITPLIDIVFLLVLFFAVSTSFISPRELEAMKDDLIMLAETRKNLIGQVVRFRGEAEEKAQAVARLDADLQTLGAEYRSLETEHLEQMAAKQLAIEQLEAAMTALDGDVQRMEWMVETLESRRDDLEKRLTERDDHARSLEEQLQQAYKDYQLLQVDLSTVQAEREQQIDEQAALLARISQLEAELEKFRQVAELDQAQVERILAAQEQLQSGLGEYLEDNRLGIKREQQRLVLQLSDQILFDSGSAEIKPAGLAVLAEVGRIVKARAGELEIQVAGHTDNVPVAGRPGLLGDNWGLSAARAVNVVQFFEREVGIDPLRLSAVGHGEHRPIADNDTAEGRAQNRRIEIVLVPR